SRIRKPTSRADSRACVHGGSWTAASMRWHSRSMADRSPARADRRLAVCRALLAGFAALAIAMASCAVPWLFVQIAAPPAIVRAALAGGAIVIGGRLPLSAARRVEAPRRG